MGLSEKAEDKVRSMPNITFRVFKSKDGNYLIHRTTITDIKPANYYKKVLDGSEPIETAEVEQA